MGLTLEKADKDVLGTAAKVVITKDSTLIVTDGSTQEAVTKRVTQLQRLVEVHHFFLFTSLQNLCFCFPSSEYVVAESLT